MSSPRGATTCAASDGESSGRTALPLYERVLEREPNDTPTQLAVGEIVPHDLRDDVVERLREQLARHDEVAKAYLVRKRLQHLEEEYPLSVVGVIPRNRWRRLWRDAQAEERRTSSRSASRTRSSTAGCTASMSLGQPLDGAPVRGN